MSTGSRDQDLLFLRAVTQCPFHSTYCLSLSSNYFWLLAHLPFNTLHTISSLLPWLCEVWWAVQVFSLLGNGRDFLLDTRKKLELCRLSLLPLFLAESISLLTIIWYNFDKTIKSPPSRDAPRNHPRIPSSCSKCWLLDGDTVAPNVFSILLCSGWFFFKSNPNCFLSRFLTIFVPMRELVLLSHL